MATMSASSREAMILGYKKGRYRLPTVREAASMMSFPIDYWFYGDSKALFVERNYDKPGQKSAPEWGINLSKKNLPLLETYREEQYFHSKKLR